MTDQIRTIETDIFGLSPRKRGINSKVKGNRNELLAAKWLEKWTGKPFSRTPMSGGLRWKTDASLVCGDVVCQDQNFNFQFSVETKHLKKLNLDKRGPRCTVFKIWKQAKTDADRANKLPLLMLRQNGMTPGSYWIIVDSFMGITACHLLDFQYKDIITFKGKQGELYAYKSEDFIRVDYSLL